MKRVVIIGSSNIDIVYSVDRLPVLGETIAGNDIQRLAGGKGLNQAVACSRIYDNTLFLGCFGSNEQFLKETIESEKLNITNLLKSDTETGTAIITRCKNDNTIVVIPSANNDVSVDYIKNNLDLFDKDSIILLQNEIKQDVNEFVINYCYDNDIITIYNPAPARKISLDLLNKVTYFTPNETEAKLIFDNENLEDIVKEYPKKVIITVGSKGVLYFDKKIINHQPQKVQVLDTTGAGDTLNGIFAAALTLGYKLDDALMLAIKGATISTTKIGAQLGMPTKEELE